MKRPASSIHFLRTTAIGGVLFLLPLIVLGALIGQVVPIVMSIAETLGEPGVVAGAFRVRHVAERWRGKPRRFVCVSIALGGSAQKSSGSLSMYLPSLEKSASHTHQLCP